ncbi:hypothetical protein H2198_006149 [Neophaeococcomyces mojaviensis]|uniref:Uncharacterized protein n=1 Tax=Neophaeococcomyces mojaviensis TaxID=3383035 RepID=A0ACC3A3S3_9EURO|nr:hypothetical protein H2198_006149 [Knufia sp. JES_112]
MAFVPQTPLQKEVHYEGNESRVDDQSEDDSDVNHDGVKRTGSTDTKHDKVHEQEDNYTIEANTDYSLFSNPPNLANIRQQLFDLKAEMEMSDTDFEQYFPFVDNVWRKSRAGETQKDHDGITEIYCCRLKPSGQAKTPTSKPHVEGKQQRRKRKREEKTCSMAMKVTFIESPSKRVRITRAVGPDEKHTHDLDYMDANKRNSAIMDVARREAHRAFLPGSIFWKMQEEPEKMEEAGGKFMKVSDVRNVQYPWRQQNMTVELKAHAGYSQGRSGPRIRRLSGSAPATPQNGESTLHIPVGAPPPAPQQPSEPPVPSLPPGTLNYPELAKDFLRPYLPYIPKIATQQRPHITLTWATSLDSRIALLPGIQTAISGPETKAMTHFLRSQHDAILIGVKTAISDDPGLNCRLAGAGGYGGPQHAMQPRPIIIDPRARLHIHPNMRLLRMAAEGKARGPWVVVGPGHKLHPQAVQTLKLHGGEFLQINEIHPEYGLDWEALFSIFHREGIKSIMIEGGGKVLSELLKHRYAHCIDSIVITIAPTFMGKNGVEVAPDTHYEGNQPIQTRLTDVKWQPMGQSDMVLCAHLEQTRHQGLLPGIQEFSRQQAPPPPANGQYSTNGMAQGPPPSQPHPHTYGPPGPPRPP